MRKACRIVVRKYEGISTPSLKRPTRKGRIILAKEHHWCGWVGTVQFAEQFQPTHTSGRQQESMTIPRAAHKVL